MDKPAKGSQMREARRDDGDRGFDGGPNKDGAHHPGDVLGFGELIEIPDTDDAGNTDAAVKSA